MFSRRVCLIGKLTGNTNLPDLVRRSIPVPTLQCSSFSKWIAILTPLHFFANILKTFSYIAQVFRHGVIARIQVRVERYSCTQWCIVRNVVRGN